MQTTLEKIKDENSVLEMKLVRVLRQRDYFCNLAKSAIAENKQLRDVTVKLLYMDKFEFFECGGGI